MPRFLIVIVCLILFSCQTKTPQVAQNSVVKPKEQGILKYEIRPSNSTEKAPLLVLLHGYGDNALNFFALSNYFDPRLTIISLYAPLDFGQNRFAWYNLDFTTRDKQGNLAEAEIARQQILATLEEVVKKHNIDAQKIYLMGFSQGTIMSLNIALTSPEKIKGAVLFSGKILKDLGTRIVEKERLKDLQIFLTHGTKDEVLFVEEGRKIHKKLKALEIEDLTYSEFNSAHTIPQEELGAAIKWLSKRLDE